MLSSFPPSLPPAVRHWVNTLKELCDVKGGGVQGGGVMV